MTTSNPVVALLTDFGTVDPFVGVMKGVILSRCPAAQIVDLTHAIPPQRLYEGAFWLERSAPHFGKGTIFVAVVDPGVGTSRRALVAGAAGRIFVGPDNGVLGAALRRDPAAVVHSVDPLRLGLSVASYTFHGRDVFAPVAAELAAGRLDVADLGARISDWDQGVFPEPVVTADTVTGEVVTVDRFGNLMTNLDVRFLAQIATPARAARASEPPFAGVDYDALTVRIGALDLPLRRTYADVADGEYVAVVGAFGVVEIARRNADAAASLQRGRGEPVTVRAS